MDNSIQEFKKYVDYAGGPRAAAKRLGVSRRHVQWLQLGKRGITPRVAEFCELDSDGLVSKFKMIFRAPEIYKGER